MGGRNSRRNLLARQVPACWRHAQAGRGRTFLKTAPGAGFALFFTGHRARKAT